METNPQSASRSALHSAAHLKSYDPSERYRTMMMPPPPVTTDMPPDNQSSLNPPSANNDPRNGLTKRIPQFYYPRYSDADHPNFVQPTQINHYVPPPQINPYAPPPVMEHPVPLSMNPYDSGQYYPYSTPYIIPLAGNVPQVDPNLIAHEQTKSEVIAAHKQDADISRLEVYHFTPKQNTSLSMRAAPPVIQYHVYPYPPGAPPPPQPQQQFPPQPTSWYGQTSNVPPYGPQPSEQVFPPAETKARGSQTEQTATKSRAVSPIYFSAAEPVYDDDGYPYVHHKTMHTDRYNVPTRRINRRVYDRNNSTLFDDCRCLDCQHERSKVLNYYPD
jgi:hypothetical protein